MWNREVDLSTVKQENRNLLNMDKLYSFTHYVFEKKMMIDILITKWGEGMGAKALKIASYNL